MDVVLVKLADVYSAGGEFRLCMDVVLVKLAAVYSAGGDQIVFGCCPC